MFKGLFKKEFIFKPSFKREGVLFGLFDNKGNKFDLPLATSTMEDLYKWYPNKYKVLSQITRLVDSLKDLQFSDKIINEFKEVYSKNDLLEPVFSIGRGSIVMAYKTIAALRFNGLRSELGIDQELLDILNIPEYSHIKFEIKTKGSFNEPKFFLEYFLHSDKRERIYPKKLIGHCLVSDKGQEYFLTPSLKLLIERLNKHKELFKKGALNSDINLRYKEFYEIKRLTIHADVILDSFSNSLENIFIDDLQYILGRDCDKEVILQEALPIKFSSFDNSFLEKLESIDLDNPPQKLVLTNKSGLKIFVSLSKKAWKTQKKIQELKNKGQDALERVIENPSEYLDGTDRSTLENIFSDRISGFIFGKPKVSNKDMKKGGEWLEGHDDYSLLIRPVNGTAVPIETIPMPDMYKSIKKAAEKLLKNIEDEELEKKIENEAYLTPLPPEKDKVIFIEELNAEFNLRTLVNTSKRIENENIPDIEDEQINYAKEVIRRAQEKDEVVITWSFQENGDLIEQKIPLQSLISALPKSQKEKVETVSFEIRKSEELDALVSGVTKKGDKRKIVPPVGLKDQVQLYKHQLIGYSWLRWLYENPPESAFENKRSGAFLADDMGLGKTIQVISLISFLKSNEKYSKGPILIVAPVSLIDGSWIKEGLLQFVKSSLINTLDKPSQYKIKNFSKCPYVYSKKALHLEACALDKEMRSKKKSLLGCKISNPLREYLGNIINWCGNHIIVTNYETLRSKSIELGCVNFSLVVLDEAQKIKNYDTLQSNAARALKAYMYIAMTGTPIENSIMDLYSIMDFVSPMKLGTRDFFKENYLSPLTRSPAGSIERKELQNNLLSKLRPIWLRRNKRDVFREGKELPYIKHYDGYEDSTVNKDAVVMSKSQNEIYKDQVGLFQTSQKGQKLAALRGMLESCHSPWLGRGEEISWSNRYALFLLCPKLKRTFKIIEDIYNNSEEKGKKVIIFANVIQVQNSLAWLLKDWAKNEKGINIEVEVYNGIPTPQARVKILDRFEKSSGFQALVISPRAGGAGLNIQFANHVIHYTREWNPALERQATDRVYRIGQKRDVHVHYPTTIAAKGDPRCAEEELANILAAKRGIMDDFTVVTQEIDINEFKGASEAEVKEDKILIGVKDLELIDNKQFEGFIACMFESLGYESKVIGKSGDRGTDVICFGEEDNYLVQVKHTKNKKNIYSKCVDEVRGGKSYYESIHKKEFKLMAVTNFYFHESTFLASNKGDYVNLSDINYLGKNIANKKFSLSQINKKAKGE